jgi:hypothetical protein
MLHFSSLRHYSKLKPKGNKRERPSPQEGKVQTDGVMREQAALPLPLDVLPGPVAQRRGHELGISSQANLLGISRGSVYYPPSPVTQQDLHLMRRMDELHLEHP